MTTDLNDLMFAEGLNSLGKLEILCVYPSCEIDKKEAEKIIKHLKKVFNLGEEG